MNVKLKPSTLCTSEKMEEERKGEREGGKEGRTEGPGMQLSSRVHVTPTFTAGQIIQRLSPDHFPSYPYWWWPWKDCSPIPGLGGLSGPVLIFPSGFTHSPKRRTAIKKEHQIPPRKTGRGMASPSCLRRASFWGRR